MQRIVFLALMCDCLVQSAVFGSWRTYEVYQPVIERLSVSDSAGGELLYNHGTAIAWYQNRWFYLWNANELPGEAKPNQLIYQSTSRDGQDWSEPSPAFASSSNSILPVTPDGGTQWQPAVGVVDDELWVFWNQWGSEEVRGSFFSRLDSPDGKWQTNRLKWGVNVSGPKEVEGWRIYPSQNLYRLRNGRILVSVIMIDQSGPAGDAPEGVEGWWALEKRNSVLYTDDGGKTWRVSAGWTLPDESWTGWEPTMWEQSDGSVRMFARHNVHPKYVQGAGLPPSQTLTVSVSHDSGETWSKGELVPLDSTVSMMHVIPQDGRGIWQTPAADDDLGGRRYFMVHNDVSEPGWGIARKNITLYFKRGDGFEFTAGVGLTDHERLVSYPRLWSRGDALYMSYTRGPAYGSSARLARISPLPDPKKYYILPRNNMPASPRPEINDSNLCFEGRQHVEAMSSLNFNDNGMSLGAFVNMIEGDVLIDTRGSGGGFVFMLVNGEGGLLYPRLLFDGYGGAGPRSSLGLKRSEWAYTGFTLDADAVEVTFYVNGRQERLPVDIGGPVPSLSGSRAYVGNSRPGSELQGMVGRMRFMSIYDGMALDASGHTWLCGQFKDEPGIIDASEGAEPQAEPVLVLDPANTVDFENNFQLPQDLKDLGVSCEIESGVELLTFSGAGSAGVELDENHRSKGDAVELKMNFRIESEEPVTLLTIGDAVSPARIHAIPSGSLMDILITSSKGSKLIGTVTKNSWNEIFVFSSDDITRVRISDGEWKEASHEPRGSWVYIGEGFPGERPSKTGKFSVKVNSILSRVN
ncbi:Neuraminidase (sialidase) [Limihaloglobus sulfuriphilus]|uniref:Neuraminidase (Sialidase) n=1 Tax=Limihaloglobus sulfuriphilus TaxID=1851148 RepID=A0A1Q2MFL3_9BACT|nr:exo-alpha-sialidase [Limihaloglobus sulfuriphilus]AQQ71486.1 Neuraminidase (sialidase) [Limihaloglobus sulfuriphilus]